MKLNRKSGRKWGALAIFITLVAGCGRPSDSATVASEDEEPQEPRISEEFRPEFLGPSASDVEIPAELGTAFDGGGAQRVWRAGDEVIFKDILQFSGSVYLGWDSTLKGKKIVSATYNFRSRDTLNRLKLPPDQRNAVWDSDGLRWFIPISKLLGGRAQELDPSIENLLAINLVLEGGATRTFLIRFRARGPLPKLAIESRPVRSVGSPSEAGAALREGRVVYVDRIENTTGRRLKVWTLLESWNFSLETTISAVRWGNPERGPAHPVGVDRRRFKAELEPQGLTASKFQLRSALLDPGRTATFEWRALASESVPRCELPPAVERLFVWFTGLPSVDAAQLSCKEGPCDRTQSELRVREEFGVRGARVKGSFRRSIYLTDPGVSLEELLGAQHTNSAWIRTLDERLIPYQDSEGTDQDEAAEASGCGGSVS